MTEKETKHVINMMFDGITEFTCLECGEDAYIRLDRRYKGYIGFCPKCDVSWRES